MKDDMKNMLPAERQVTTVRRVDKLLDPEGFAHLQRVGSMIALSPMFPDHLRKGTREEAIANAVLVLNLADRLGEDVMAVAQSVYFVGGKPGWAASYAIGKANQYNVFRGTIKWRYEGEGDDLEATAYATLAETGEEVSAEASMAMAKAEGWTRNPKYKSMPKVMLRYRSAMFLIRAYCPEVLMGMRSTEEIEDVRFAEARDVTPMAEPEPEPEPEKKPAAGKAKARNDADDADVVDDKPEPKPKAEQKPTAQQGAKADGKPEPKADEKPKPDEKADPAPAIDINALPEEWRGPVSAMKYQMENAASAEEIEALIDAYSGDIAAAEAEAPDAHKVIEALVAEARAGFDEAA